MERLSVSSAHKEESGTHQLNLCSRSHRIPIDFKTLYIIYLQQFVKIMSIAKYLCSPSGVVSKIGNVVNESSASTVLECAPTGDRY